MDCIFCKIINNDIPAKILKETLHSICFLDAFPLAKGHVLVIPKNHHKKLQDMNSDENGDLFSLVHTMISKVDSITGSTLVAIHNGENAGQEVPHVHVHLVPRSNFDSAGPIHNMFNSSLKLSKSEIEKSKEIVLAFDKAEMQGLAVVSLGSKMIDPPVVKRAQYTINLGITSGLVSKNWKLN